MDNTYGAIKEKSYNTSNHTWYLKYTNGYCEQGGFYKGNTDGINTITFPIPFTEIYNITRTNKSNSSDNARYRTVGYLELTTTYFKFHCGTTQDNARELRWMASGTIVV